MPGLKTPPDATPPQVHLPHDFDFPKYSNASTPTRGGRGFPLPSPFSSPRARSLPDRRRRTPPADESPDLGPFLLKLARDAMVSGDGPSKALDYAIRASKALEGASAGRPDPGLDLALSLHVVAAIQCNLGRPEEAARVLERAVRITDPSLGPDHELAAFCGYMQLGDARSMLGQLDRSVSAYESGLKIQMDSLGDADPRIGETSRYLAEAYVQAMRLDEAENLCKRMLEIHRLHSPPASLEEASDRRLMALICVAKGDHETALEHLVLASMSMIASGQGDEVAAVDVSIGNVYLSLSRFEEAIFSYQKALTVFKSTRGETHPSVASIYTRLADLYFRTGKLRESKSYCENALRIYAEPKPGSMSADIATGLTEIAAIYGAANDPEEGLRILQQAMQLLEDNKAVHSTTIAGTEAQMGVMFYMVGRHWEAWCSFESAVAKLRASGESKSAFFGVVLNQMGLACVQLYKIKEAAVFFEEAKDIMEEKCGPRHPETLGVYSNLAATYDAMGRVEDAIHALEYILKVREEELGTANPEVDDEKRRLSELLREVGRSRSRKAKSLESLLDSEPPGTKMEGARWHSGLISRA